MKEINNSDIGLIIGFYDDKNILQIASIYEVMDDYIVTDLNERVAKKDIVDVGFVDLNKHNQLQARIKEFEGEEHINEIKAQYLEWIIKTIEDKCKAMDPMGIYEPAIDIKTLKGELKKLRTNHD